MYSAIDSTTAWEIAGFASHNNFPDVFKLAIAAFHEASWPETDDHCKALPLLCLQEIPPRYATALVTAVLKHKIGYLDNAEKKWRAISESFKLEDD